MKAFGSALRHTSCELCFICLFSVLVGVKLSQHILERPISFTLMVSLQPKVTGKETNIKQIYSVS